MFLTLRGFWSMKSGFEAKDYTDWAMCIVMTVVFLALIWVAGPQFPVCLDWSVLCQFSNGLIFYCSPWVNYLSRVLKRTDTIHSKTSMTIKRHIGSRSVVIYRYVIYSNTFGNLIALQTFLMIMKCVLYLCYAYYNVW